MKNELTERQNEILQFIQEFHSQTGYPPTLREIGKKFGISSTFGVKRHLDALEKKGFINIESNASRGISIIKDNSIDTVFLNDDNLNRIPIIGRVAAGSPILAEENIEGSIVIDPSFMQKAGDSFALKVKGDSMINAGIFENDLVIVQPKKNAINGEVVVAMLNGEVTVKRFEFKNNSISLIPENINYQPINVTEEYEFSIIGKVVGVLRWIN